MGGWWMVHWQIEELSRLINVSRGRNLLLGSFATVAVELLLVPR